MEARANLRARGMKVLTTNVGESRSGFRKRVKGVARMVAHPFSVVKAELKKDNTGSRKLQ